VSGPAGPAPGATATSDSTSQRPLATYPGTIRDQTVAYLGAHERPPLADLLAALPLPADLSAHDACADWHYTTPRPAMVRTLLYNYPHGWQNDSRLHRALRHDPYLLGRLGFDTVPDQSTLWRVQHKQFSGELLQTLRAAAAELAAVARDHGYDLPGPASQNHGPKDGRDGRLRGPGPAIENAQSVTEQARRLVYPHLELDRADNWAIPESAFWDLQRYIGLQEERHANAGAREFALESDHEVTPLGHNHREQVRKQYWWQYRSYFQDAIASVVDELKRAGQFQRPVTVAIDTTEGSPFLGDREGLERNIIGTKEPSDGYAYQWATTQVVDHDCPLVLDAVPVQLGDSVDDLVEMLLSSATDHVSIDLVVMDKEFDSNPVKAVCEEYGLSYLNPARKYTSEAEHCRRLAARDATVDVQRRTPTDAPNHCQLYVPKRNGPQVTTDEVQRILVPPEPEGDDEESDRHDELWADLEETLSTDVDAASEPDEEEADEDDDVLRYLAALAGDGEYQPREGAPADQSDHYVVFETNHPSLDPDDDAADQCHAAARLMRRYRHRWETENAYKRFKPFMAETTSTSFALRYFYFGFAALVLYNLWKVVGLLVAERMNVAAEEVDLPASTALALVGKETGIG
jgi:putative transposase